MNGVKKQEIITHPTWEMASINFGSLAIELIQGVLSIVLFFFYEQVLGLQSILAGIGIAIYALYDAFNDPLVGHITDRVFPWTKKWGRRFPFIAVFFIPMLVCFLLIFSPPVFVQGNQVTLFIWLIFTTCIFDTFESFFTINYWALEPDKFRDQDERKVLGSFEVFLGFVGVLFSFLIPPMVVDEDIASTYSVMAWICVIIALIAYVLMLPGVRDDQKNVDDYIEKYDKEKEASFIESIKFVLKQKSFLAFLFMYILYQAMIQLMQASVFYHAIFVLGMGEDIVTFMLLMFFIGGLISVPLWLKYTKKTGDNRRSWIMAASMMAVFSVFLTFMFTLPGVMIILFLYGLGFGGFWVLTTPIYSDVIDESVVLWERRKEAVYGGLRQFFINSARVIQAMTLAIVHELTGFVEGADTQGPLAIFGIQLHFGLLPAIYLFIGIFIFWKLYDITPDKIKEHKKKLAELGL
ncbi:MAG: MFS transporter [Promethearchaeia archaeon]